MTTPVTTTIQKKNFCPALYLPTSGSSRSANFRYSSTLNLRSALSNTMSFSQTTAITAAAAANATPSQARSQRQTESPPQKYAIQPNNRHPNGMPVNKEPKKNT